MYFEQHFDWTAFVRLDNAVVIDFLSSLAGALAERGLLTSKDTDNLRVSLSTIQTEQARRDEPVLLQITRDNPDFMIAVAARYGTSNFSRNLLRRTTREAASAILRALSEWGTGLVKKSHLLFNRPFNLYVGGNCECSTLFSTMIVGWAERLASACTYVDEALAALSAMLPSTLAGDGDAAVVDEAVARATGFSGISAEKPPFYAEDAILRALANAALIAADTTAIVIEQLQRNHEAVHLTQIALLCDWLRSEAKRIGELALPSDVNLEAWEIRRQGLLLVLHSLTNTINQLSARTLEALGAGHSSPQPLLPGNVLRRVVSDMIGAGLSPQRAQGAATALVAYLERHDLSAKDLVTAELGKIHADLSAHALRVFQEHAPNPQTGNVPVSERERTHKRAAELMAQFQRHLGLGVALAVLLLVVSGCGFKTLPKSDVIDYRPDIPARITSPAPVKTDATNLHKESGHAP